MQKKKKSCNGIPYSMVAQEFRIFVFDLPDKI